MRRDKCLKGLAVLILLAILCIPISATEPVWQYSDHGLDIGGVAMSSTGNSIAVAAGKILFFSGNGSLLSKEPFADQVTITPDGSTLLASYFSRVYLFRKNPQSNTDPANPYLLQWEKELPSKVRTMDISDDGKIITVSTEGKGLYLFSNDGNTTGYNDSYFPVARVSADGRVIAAISQEGITTFARNGRVLNKPEPSLTMQPKFMLLSSKGNITVFNDGQKVRQVFTNNGTSVWETRASGDISSLDMTQSGSAVIVGSENGFIDYIDNQGNLLWSYSTTGKGQTPSPVRCVAVSDSGEVITAGTLKGTILYLKKSGELIWNNTPGEHIQHISMNSDGSRVVATGDNTLYGYSLNSPTPTKTTGLNRKIIGPEITVNRSTPRYPLQVLEETITPEITLAQPTPVPVEYSVVHTSTRIPLPPGICILAICAGLLLHARTNKR